MRTELHPINPDHLPKKAREIAECIGLPDFLRLVEWRGGTWVYVPEIPKPHHAIVKIIGLASAQKLAFRFAARLEIPKCDIAARTALHAAIAQRRANGESELQVALDTGFSGRWIRKIYSRHQTEEMNKQKKLL